MLSSITDHGTNIIEVNMNNLYIKGLVIDWDKISDNSYLHDIKSVRSLNSMEFKKNVTFFVGENQSGKSTLLEAIAVAYGFNPEGGTLNFNFSTYDDVSELCDAIRLSKGILRPKSHYFFRAESFFNVSSKAEEYDAEECGHSYGTKHLHEQSHGESFLSFIEHYNYSGIFILDEPEAALSPQRQLRLFIHISDMVKKGAQFIIATHSPILLAIPDAEILSFDDGYIHTCRYEEAECYKVMEMFINHKDNIVKELLL